LWTTVLKISALQQRHLAIFSPFTIFFALKRSTKTLLCLKNGVYQFTFKGVNFVNNKLRA